MILLGLKKLHARYRKGPNDVDLHFFYKNEPKRLKLEEIGADDGQCMDFFNKNIGNYPYKQYSFIQGGDGMYAMSTLMLGNGTLEGIYGTATHELGFLVPTRFGFK
jgi:hypothetical protein